MAIAFDAFSKSAYRGFGTFGGTLAHTCTGSNLRLWFYAYCGNGDAVTVTYNGTSMTAGPFLAMTGAASGQYIRSWFLDNPTTGTNNIVWSTTTNCDTYGFGASYTGVAQTGTLDSSNTGGGSPLTSLTVSTTTIADNCWLTGFCYTGTTPTMGSNTTSRANTNNVLHIIDSNSAQTPAGSKSMAITFASSFAGMLIASNAPISTSTPANPAFLLNFM